MLHNMNRFRRCTFDGLLDEVKQHFAFRCLIVTRPGALTRAHFVFSFWCFSYLPSCSSLRLTPLLSPADLPSCCDGAESALPFSLPRIFAAFAQLPPNLGHVPTQALYRSLRPLPSATMHRTPHQAWTPRAESWETGDGEDVCFSSHIRCRE